MSSTDSGESTHLPADDEPPSASCSSAKSPSAGPLLAILTHPAANGHATSGSHDRSNGLLHQNGTHLNGPILNGPILSEPILSEPILSEPILSEHGQLNG